MPNRREFLQTSAAVTAIAANGVIVRGAEAAGARPPAPLGSIVYDDRYAEGRRFAAVAGAPGLLARALDAGDITRLWQAPLEDLFRDPFGIAGFTQFGPMFVVERAAAERGWRLALRVEHRGAADGGLTHVFSAPRETLELARSSEALRADWPAVMAMLASRAIDDDSPWRSGELVVPGLDAPRLPPSSAAAAPFVHYYTPLAEQLGLGPALDGPLYTWVVAPRPRRG